MSLQDLATAILQIAPEIKLNKTGDDISNGGSRIGTGNFKRWLLQVPRELRGICLPDDDQDIHRLRQAIKEKLLEERQNIALDPELENIALGVDIMKKQYYVIEDGAIQKEDYEAWKIGLDEDQLGLLHSSLQKIIIGFDPDKPLSWTETINTTKGPKDYKSYNSYISPHWKRAKPPTDYQDIEAKLLTFFEAFVPDNEEREWVIYWLYTLMHRRCEYLLVLRGIQGSGKTLLARLASLIAGEENSTLTGLKFGSDKFNTEIAKRKLAFLDEFKMKETQREAIKNWSNAKITVEGKGVDPIVVKNHCSFIIASNYEKHIVLEHNDRRFLVPTLCSDQIQNIIGEDILNLLWDGSDPDHESYSSFAIKFPHWIKHYVESQGIEKDYRFPLKTEEFYKICEFHKPKWFRVFKEIMRTNGSVNAKLIHRQTRTTVADATIMDRIEIETDERRERGLETNWVEIETSEEGNNYKIVMPKEKELEVNDEDLD